MRTRRRARNAASSLALRRTRGLDELCRLERKLLREKLLDRGVVEAEGDVDGRAVAEEVDQLEQLQLLVPAELLDERLDEAARELVKVIARDGGDCAHGLSIV